MDGGNTGNAGMQLAVNNAYFMAAWNFVYLVIIEKGVLNNISSPDDIGIPKPIVDRGRLLL